MKSSLIWLALVGCWQKKLKLKLKLMLIHIAMNVSVFLLCYVTVACIPEFNLKQVCWCY